MLIATAIAVVALALTPFVAVADDPVTSTTVAVPPAPSGAPSVTASTTTSLTTAPTLSTTASVSVDPTTTSGPVEVTSSAPITATTTTTVSPTATAPVVTTAEIAGPGTTGASLAGVSTAPEPTIIPSVDTSGLPRSAGVPEAGTSGGTDPSGASVGANVSDASSGIALAGNAALSLCVLSSAITDPAARPILTATVSTLCDGKASTAGGGGSVIVPGVASGTLDSNAAICLIAKATGVPTTDLSSGDPSSGGTTLDPVATATIQAACNGSTATPKGGPTPDTLTANGSVDVPSVGPTTLDVAAAVCLLGVASGGIPATASVSSICGLETGGGEPSPSTVDTGGSTTVPGITPEATLSAAVCLVASALVGEGASLDLAGACATPAGSTPPSGPAAALSGSAIVAGSANAPSVNAEGGANPAGAAPAASLTTPAAQPGAPEGQAQTSGLPLTLTRLPSTATATGLGALVLVILLSLAALRRRMT